MADLSGGGGRAGVPTLAGALGVPRARAGVYAPAGVLLASGVLACAGVFLISRKVQLFSKVYLVLYYYHDALRFQDQD